MLKLNLVERKTGDSTFGFSVVLNFHMGKQREIVIPHYFRHLSTSTIRQSLQVLLMDRGAVQPQRKIQTASRIKRSLCVSSSATGGACNLVYAESPPNFTCPVSITYYLPVFKGSDHFFKNYNNYLIHKLFDYNVVHTSNEIVLEKHAQNFVFVSESKCITG